jgi:hypothetical protein
MKTGSEDKNSLFSYIRRIFMSPRFYALLVVGCFILLLPGISQAISVSAATSPAAPMTANITTTIAGASCPFVSASYGDGQQALIGQCVGPASCTFNVSHTYAAPGIYTVTITGSSGFPVGGLCPGVTPPNPASVTIAVGTTMTITSPAILPAGTLAGAYSYQIQTTGGILPLKYSLVSGKLPAGLSLGSGGLISGTPTALGTFTFSVQVSDASLPPLQSTPKVFSLTVNPPSFAGPSSMKTSVPQGITSTRTIPYQLTASTPITVPLVSTAGVFSAGGTVLETNNQPLTVSMQKGQGKASEVITISPTLIEKALRQNSNVFTYQRSFTLGGAFAKETAQSPVIFTSTLNISILTEGSSPFDIKTLQLYFENRLIDITVDRNYPKLKAYVDILPLGSGILQGNWTVDGRIISNVVQPLAAGQAITLQTPDIPPLPTYEVGTHQLKFNVINPVTSVQMPTIIYHVSPTESVLALARITLLSPLLGSQQPYSSINFQWEGFNFPVLYLVEFYSDEKGINPMFSAFTQKTHYALPARTFTSFFEKGATYYWKVTALNETKNPVGESERRSFIFKK